MRPTSKVPLGLVETIVGELRDREPARVDQIRRAVEREWDEKDAESFDIKLVLDRMAALGLVVSINGGLLWELAPRCAGCGAGR